MCGERANANAFSEAGGSDQECREERVQTDVVIDAERAEAAEVAMGAKAIDRHKQLRHDPAVKRRRFCQQHLGNRWLDFRLSGRYRSS